MRYNFEVNRNCKQVTIPDGEIKNNMELLDLTEQEAINLWLEDNGYLDNQEQIELNEKAKQVKIDHDARAATAPKEKKPRTTKVSDEKKELFATIVRNLDRAEGVERENVTILKENKLIEVKIGEKTFKIDVIESRPPKK
jgi:hypothetical protein